MRAWRWWNFWIPSGLGLLLAGLLSDLPTSGWTERQALGWLVIIVTWPVFTYLAVAFTGFVCGVVGVRPMEMTSLFSSGVGAAERLRRTRPPADGDFDGDPSPTGKSDRPLGRIGEDRVANRFSSMYWAEADRITALAGPPRSGPDLHLVHRRAWEYATWGTPEVAPSAQLQRVMMAALCERAQVPLDELIVAIGTSKAVGLYRQWQLAGDGTTERDGYAMQLRALIDELDSRYGDSLVGDDPDSKMLRLARTSMDRYYSRAQPPRTVPMLNERGEIVQVSHDEPPTADPPTQR